MPRGGAYEAAPQETRQKAVEELRLRKASGVQISGIGKKYGVSDTAVRAWARAAEAGSKEPGARKKIEYTEEQRNAAVMDWANGDSGVSIRKVAAKHKIPERTLRDWIHGKKIKRKEKAPVNAKPAEKRPRRVHDNAFKARVVEDFIQRPKGTYAQDIAKKHDISEGLLNAWVRKSRDGKLPTAAEPDRSEPTQLARASRSNGHTQLSAQLHLSMGEAPPPGQSGLVASLPLQVQLYVQRLETQNKALRKMLQIAMEAI